MDKNQPIDERWEKRLRVKDEIEEGEKETTRTSVIAQLVPFDDIRRKHGDWVVIPEGTYGAVLKDGMVEKEIEAGKYRVRSFWEKIKNTFGGGPKEIEFYRVRTDYPIEFTPTLKLLTAEGREVEAKVRCTLKIVEPLQFLPLVREWKKKWTPSKGEGRTDRRESLKGLTIDDLEKQPGGEIYRRVGDYINDRISANLRSLQYDQFRKKQASLAKRWEEELIEPVRQRLKIFGLRVVNFNFTFNANRWRKWEKEKLEARKLAEVERVKADERLKLKEKQAEMELHDIKKSKQKKLLETRKKADIEIAESIGNAQAEAESERIKQETRAKNEAMKTRTRARAEAEAKEEKGLADVKVDTAKKMTDVEVEKAAKKELGMAEAEVTEAQGKAEAEAMKKKGMAEAEVTEAQGKAEAEAMKKRAEAEKKRGEAIAETMKGVAKAQTYGEKLEYEHKEKEMAMQQQTQKSVLDKAIESGTADSDTIQKFLAQQTKQKAVDRGEEVGKAAMESDVERFKEALKEGKSYSKEMMEEMSNLAESAKTRTRATERKEITITKESDDEDDDGNDS